MRGMKETGFCHRHIQVRAPVPRGFSMRSRLAREKQVLTKLAILNFLVLANLDLGWRIEPFRVSRRDNGQRWAVLNLQTRRCLPRVQSKLRISGASVESPEISHSGSDLICRRFQDGFRAMPVKDSRFRHPRRLPSKRTFLDNEPYARHREPNRALQNISVSNLDWPGPDTLCGFAATERVFVTFREPSRATPVK